jgi:hypothetical protein
MVLKTMKKMTWEQFREVFPEISTNEIEAQARSMGRDIDFNDCTIPPGLYSRTSLAVHLACHSGGPIQYQGMYMDAKTLKLVVNREWEGSEADRLNHFHARMDLLEAMGRIRDMFNQLADCLEDLESKIREHQQPCEGLRLNNRV